MLLKNTNCLLDFGIHAFQRCVIEIVKQIVNYISKSNIAYFSLS